ncbi:GCK [Artemisia annua]|uniref:GCK n=1 Tax=Artemisia annua TaxID=35608 RepID=A0A2U1LUU3_ARTAN|nr:GCK [Artemisia annua]
MGAHFSSPCDDKLHRDNDCFSCYMKKGECKKTYIKYKQCVEEGEKNDENIVNKCFQVTSDLVKCMNANQHYYSEALQAEKDPGFKIFMIMHARKEANKITRKKSSQAKN